MEVEFLKHYGLSGFLRFLRRRGRRTEVGHISRLKDKLSLFCKLSLSLLLVFLTSLLRLKLEFHELYLTGRGTVPLRDKLWRVSEDGLVKLSRFKLFFTFFSMSCFCAQHIDWCLDWFPCNLQVKLLELCRAWHFLDFSHSKHLFENGFVKWASFKHSFAFNLL